MSYTRFKGSFLSTNKINTVNYYICEPEMDIRAIILFAHGWVDCFARNDNLIDYFTSHGILVCGCDFIGHDFSNKDEFGDFKKKNAWTYLVGDLLKFHRFIHRTYKDLPIFLYGHGLGSLVARMSLIQNKPFEGVILSGTSGTQIFCRRAKFASLILKACKGADYRSPLIKSMMEKKVNYRFKYENDEKAWECSESSQRFANNMGGEGDLFYCMGALRDMFHMLENVSSRGWYRQVPKNLPILLISGEEDPIGAYGKGVREVEKKLQREGCQVTTHLYAGMRHNIHDEPHKSRVFVDVLSWMKSYLNE